MSYSYTSLSDFVSFLETQQQLRRIPLAVDPILEIAEITDRVSKRGGPALLFEHPKGSRYPVLINLFGTARRMALSLGVESVDEIALRIEELLEMKPPSGILGKLKMLPKLAELGNLLPKVVKNGPCQEVVRTEKFSLFDYPILKCWPEDGGRYITLPLVFSKNPVTGKRNCGMYRMQVYDETTTGMHWQVHKHGAQHFREAKAQDAKDAAGRRRMDVAVAIGADPAVSFSAIAPLPDDLDEMMFAGFLRGARSKWSGARPWTWKCRPTRRSFWKATSIWTNCARRVLLAIIQGSTRWPINTRFFTSPA